MSAPRSLLQLRRLRSTVIYVVAGSILLKYQDIHNFNRTVNDSPFQSRLPTDPGRQRHSLSKNVADPALRKKQSRAPSITDSEEPETYSPASKDDDNSAWGNFLHSINYVREAVSTFDWVGVPDRITTYVMPSWALQLPGFLQKLQFELSMDPGTLADEIWQEAADDFINPEILWDASVRVSQGLCDEELEFQRKRRRQVVPALAAYLEVDQQEIDFRDVPTIAVCGSGGGLRALVAGTGSMLAAQEDGLFDCVTYTAGVSGSCWLQTLYHTSLGNQNFERLALHLKTRIGVHIAFPPAALKLVASAPTNKYLLSGFVEKLKGDPAANFGLVDIYGLLLAARLMIPKGELGVREEDLKLSNQRTHLTEGLHPMPIYTAVRHEIPAIASPEKGAAVDQTREEYMKQKAREEAWFQWFEFTPYEIFCEEFSAGIPTWALGRPFKGGRNTILEDRLALPEMRIPLMLGIWGSAFCATLSHYYQEVKPVFSGLAGFGGLDSLLADKNEDLVKIHPIDPASIPNFVYGMEDQLPPTCPKSVFETDHLQLMDAGMSNNLPIYPLLRPGRDVDILIAFDASADIKNENWLSVVDGYARQRGIQGWPIGTGWPKKSTKVTENVEALEEAEVATPEEAANKVAEAQETNGGTNEEHSSADLGYCTIWVGTKTERTTSEEPPPSKRFDKSALDSDSSFHLLQPNAGLTLVYFPFVANQSKVPDIDPTTSEFMSTWNFIYTPDDVEGAVNLARANYAEGKDQVRRCVRAVWERKRKERLEKERGIEDENGQPWLETSVRRDGDHFS